MLRLGWVAILFLGVGPGFGQESPLGQSGFATKGEVKIHYVTRGQGPLLILIHGFPDFHYTWRDQIPELSKSHQVVAIDQRGYNLSDQPRGVESYTLDKLVADVIAVMEHLGHKKMKLAGHDWGGFVAWNVAARHPDKVERLMILNLPHPHGLMRELASNPEQQKNSEYARNFQKEDAATRVKPEALVQWVKEPEARKVYLEAMKRSSMEGMLNYYKANYPRPPYASGPKLPNIQCPVLVIHGLNDKALLPEGLNDTWKWVDKELTLITVPGAGHFVHRDKPDLVTRKMVTWLREN